MDFNKASQHLLVDMIRNMATCKTAIFMEADMTICYDVLMTTWSKAFNGKIQELAFNSFLHYLDKILDVSTNTEDRYHQVEKHRISDDWVGIPNILTIWTELNEM